MAVTAEETASLSSLARSGAPRRSLSAVRVHVALLVVAAIVLVVSSRGIQPLWDDWIFLRVLTSGQFSWEWVLTPHNGHVMMPTKLLYAVTYGVMGASAIIPLTLVGIALHLTFCHLLWRVAVREGVSPWLATWGMAAFTLWAPGIENILFAFQMGLQTTFVATLLLFLEVERARPRLRVVLALSTLAVISFGTAPIFLAVVGGLALVRRRWSAIGGLVPSAVLYVVLFASFGSAGGERLPAVGDWLLLVLFFVLGVGNSVAQLLPWRVLVEGPVTAPTVTAAYGAVVGAVVLIAAWVLTRLRSELRPSRLLAACALVCPVYFAVTAVPRLVQGVDGALLSRYAYIGAAFLLPWLLRLVDLAWQRFGFPARVLTVSAAVLCLAQAVAFVPVAHDWVGWTRTSTRIIAAGQQIVRSGQPVVEQPSPEFGFLTPAQTLTLDVTGGGRLTARDRLSGVIGAQTAITPVPSTGDCVGPPRSRISLALDDPAVDLTIAARDPFTVVFHDASGRASHPRAMRLDPGAYQVSSLGSARGGVMDFSAAGAVFVACGSRD